MGQDPNESDDSRVPRPSPALLGGLTLLDGIVAREEQALPDAEVGVPPDAVDPGELGHGHVVLRGDVAEGLARANVVRPPFGDRQRLPFAELRAHRQAVGGGEVLNPHVITAGDAAERLTRADGVLALLGVGGGDEEGERGHPRENAGSYAHGPASIGDVGAGASRRDRPIVPLFCAVAVPLRRWLLVRAFVDNREILRGKRASSNRAIGSGWRAESQFDPISDRMGHNYI